MAPPRILGIGTANPPASYSQQDVLDRYRIEDPKIVSLFHGSHIDRRYLYLPPLDETTGRRVEERAARIVDPGERLRDRGTSRFSRIPRFQHGVSMLLGPVHRQRAAVHQHDHQWAPGGGQRFEQ